MSDRQERKERVFGEAQEVSVDRLRAMESTLLYSVSVYKTKSPTRCVEILELKCQTLKDRGFISVFTAQRHAAARDFLC